MVAVIRQKFFSASLQPQLSALKKIFWLADVKGAAEKDNNPKSK